MGLRVFALASGIATLGDRPVVDDYLARFEQIAAAPGVPYRDFELEYLPGQYVLIELLVGPDAHASGARIAVAAFAADLGIVALLFRRLGREAAAWYLVLGAPLLLFSYGGFDHLSCLLAVGAVAAAATSRERRGGLLLASAVLTRAWPLLVLPSFVVAGRSRAARWALGGLVAGTAAGLLLAGPSAVGQVATFRGAEGWEFESVIGTIAWIGGAAASDESGAFRVGSAPGWARIALGAVALAFIAFVWSLAREGDRAFGPAMLATLGGILLVSPLFSFPFVIWLIPWSAMACVASGDRRIAHLSGAVAILTLAAVITFPSKEQFPLLTQGLLLARDGVLVVLVIRCITWLRISSARTTRRSGGLVRTEAGSTGRPAA